MLDATFTRVKGKKVAIHIAYDTGIGVVDYWIDDTENKTAYFYILQRLKFADYKINCVISDKHWAIIPAVNERNLPHQLCIFHLVKELRLKLRDKRSNELIGEHKILFCRLKWILNTKKIEDLPVRLKTLRKLIPAIKTKKAKEIIKQFWRELPSAVLHLSFAEYVPNTTALLENLNGQIKQRLKTFRGVKSEDSLNKLLKILFYFRNYK